MFIELVDSLRCPNAHEDTWLVAAPSRMAGRYILTGTLGCPVCRAEYEIREGIAEMGAGVESARIPGDEQSALRLAAFLDLTDASGVVLLAGTWANDASALRDVVAV